MKPIYKVTIAATLGSVIAIGAAAAQDSLRIGAMREGSSWYVFAATLENMLEPSLADTDVEVIARGGGVANPMVVQNGDAEVALSNVATSVWARQGHDMYQGASAPDIRALVGGLNSVYMGVMARNDFMEEHAFETLEDIFSSGEPVSIVLKPTGSAAVPTTQMILEALGTSFDGIEENGGDVIQVETAQIPQVVRDGQADVYFDTIINGHPVITEVTLTGDVRFLDLPAPVLEYLSENGLNPGEYGPWFENQDGPNMGADFGTVLIAHADLSDDVAYEITRTLVENAEAMGEAHAAWRTFDPEQAFRPENTGIPLHPGAERYYRERGWM